MKKSEAIKSLAAYLVRKDQHIALTAEMGEQLAKYMLAWADEVGMNPPGVVRFNRDVIGAYDITFPVWEAEDET